MWHLERHSQKDLLHLLGMWSADGLQMKYLRAQSHSDLRQNCLKAIYTFNDRGRQGSESPLTGSLWCQHHHSSSFCPILLPSPPFHGIDPRTQLPRESHMKQKCNGKCPIHDSNKKV